MSGQVLCVLRSGGEYRPEHVLRLRDQLAQFAPKARLLCLSDVEIDGVATEPLLFRWPGWWAKMEMFRPDLGGDFLFLDLDVRIVGEIDGFMGRARSCVMRDVYRPGGLQSAAMFLKAEDRADIWRRWIERPEHWMRKHRRGGDQAFLEPFWLSGMARMQDELPGQLVSYKADVLGRGVPDAARIVMFHGRPRPWEVGW